MTGWQVRKVQAFLDERHGGPVRLAEAAAVIKRSPSYFARAFKATFGKTLGDHLRVMRIETAKRMLLNGDERLAVIALACGFCDQAHMTRLFSRVVGLSPQRWRRDQRQSATHLRGPAAAAVREPARSRAAPNRSRLEADPRPGPPA